MLRPQQPFSADPRLGSSKGIQVLSGSFPARHSAITRTRTFDSCFGQIREGSFRAEIGKAARSGKKWNKCGLELVITTPAGICHGPSRHPSVKAGKNQRGQGRWKFQSLPPHPLPRGSPLTWKDLGTSVAAPQPQGLFVNS